MNAYNIATVWILTGVTAWVFHVVYAWIRSTAWLRNVMIAIAAIYIKESCVNSLDSKNED